MNIGKKVAHYREKKGLNKVELARLANIPQSAISQIENGDTANPGVRTLANIARALNISVCALLTDQKITMIDELPAPKRAKAALSDPAFQEPLELALFVGICYAGIG